MKQVCEARGLGAAERGAALLFSMIVVAVMSVLGILVMDNIAMDLDSTGAERTATEALYNAEAGVQWAMDDIGNRNIVPNDGATYQNELWDPLTPLGAGDADCVVLGCTTRNWYLLHAAQDPMPFGDGTFRAFVSDDEISDNAANPADGNGIIVVRAIGRVSGGVRRMVEVMIEPVGP